MLTRYPKPVAEGIGAAGCTNTATAIQMLTNETVSRVSKNAVGTFRNCATGLLFPLVKTERAFEDMAAAAADPSLRAQSKAATERTQALLDTAWMAVLQSEKDATPPALHL